MATHYIPRDVRGETRILLIFTTKSLLTTGALGAVGLVLYFIIGYILGLTMAGVILLVIFAIMGFLVGTIKIPKITGLPFTKNVAGDSIDEIVIRYIKFKMNKKIYTYTKEEK